MGTSAGAGSLKLRKRILDFLAAPKFVHRYQLNDRDTISGLRKKLVDRVAAAKYEWFLANYNTMLLFEWPRDNTIGRDYYWREFANSVGGTSAHEKRSDTVFLSDRLSNTAFNNCLGTQVASGPLEHRCLFHNGLEARSLAALVRSVAVSSKGPKLKALALCVDFEGDRPVNDFVTSLQPVLEEAVNMYKDIHYEKLLQIAKQADSDFSVKEMLATLADNDLSSPALVRHNSWLMFASSKDQLNIEREDQSTN